MLLQILAEILTADNGLSLTGSYLTVSFSESVSSQHGMLSALLNLACPQTVFLRVNVLKVHKAIVSRFL